MINHILYTLLDCFIFVLVWFGTPVLLAVLGFICYWIYCKVTGKKMDLNDNEPSDFEKKFEEAKKESEEKRKQFEKEYEATRASILEHQKSFNENQPFFNLKNEFPQFQSWMNNKH